MDQSADTAGQQVEPEEEMEEPEEIEPPPAAVPFSRLFACADRLDWALMLVGSLAAAAHGTALVVYLHYFAKIVHVLRINPREHEEQFEKFREVIYSLRSRKLSYSIVFVRLLRKFEMGWIRVSSLGLILLAKLDSVIVFSSQVDFRSNLSVK